MQILELGDIRIEPGTADRGFLRVSETPSGAPIAIPLYLAAGRADGPVLLVDSTVHGEEATGTVAICKLMKELDPSQLRGTLIAVPCVNTPAFDSSAHYNHLQYESPQDLNLAFPGRPVGTLAEMTAYTYYNEIVKKAEVLLAFHTGSAELGPLDCVIVPPSRSPDFDRRVDGLARAVGLERIWTGMTAPSGTGNRMLEQKAAEDGIPALVVEIGCQCAWYSHGDGFVDASVRAVRNVMKFLGMLDGEPERPASYVYSTQYPLAIFNRRGGIWQTNRRIGERLRKGDVIGTVSSLLNEELETVTAPFDGVVFQIKVWPVAYPGGLVCCFSGAETRS